MEKKLDLRVEKTYLSLHRAFTELMEQRHFEDFTVNELCERAMIRRTTFYKHFADKYEYFAFYMREICGEFCSRMPGDRESMGVNEYFLHMCRELVEFVERHRKMVDNAMNSSVFPVLMDSMMEYIRADVLEVLRSRGGEAAGMGRQELVAAFYAGGIANSLRLFLRRGKRVQKEEFIASVSEFLGVWT